MVEQAPIDRLIAGFRGFRAIYVERRPEVYRALVDKGQSPAVMIIACSDSRVDPAILTQAEPGELFVVRNVANVVPPYQPDGHYHGTSAAIEFAVRDLGVSHLIILGHALCGGIQALMGGMTAAAGEREFISPWMTVVGDACAHLPAEGTMSDAERGRIVEQAAIQISLNNLKSYPWVEEKVGQNRLRLHGWWFDLEGGKLWAWNPITGRFAPRT